ncbi:MAG: cyclic nucleotide-binding domain-containing protein [Candidatus Hinthialibacter antarcticus]|nr:cyclic nucleotide-binding domain-containing protein [Candidatus Hinthialibacter antarcticus]
MVRILQKLFQVHEGEGAKVFFFSLLGALLQAGVAIGYVGSDSLFISYLGVQSLPYIYFILPLLMFFVTPLTSLITQRVGVLKMQLLTCALLVFGGIGLYQLAEIAITSGDESYWMFFIVKLYSAICYIAVYTIYWNFVDAYFDILSAKRLFPLLSGANAVGATVGGYLVTLFMGFQIEVGYLFLLWSGLSLLSLAPIFSLRRFSTLIDLEADSSGSVRQQIYSLGQGFKKSKYVIFLTVSSFLGMILAYICEFQYMQIFEHQYTDEDSLANMLGYMFMLANIFNTIVVLLLFNRMIVNFGVRNIALIQPIAYLVLFAGYVAVFGSPESMLVMAIVGFFAYQGVQTSIEYNNFNLIINPIPREIKTSVRTIIEGWIEPFGVAVAGFTLIVFSEYIGLSHLEMSLIALWIGLVYLATILIMRAQYAGATVQSLKDEWLDFNVSETQQQRILSDEELSSLREVIQTGGVKQKLTACRMLWKHDQIAGVTELLRLWEEADADGRTIYSRLLSEMYSQNNNDVNRLILDWIVSQDEPTRQVIIKSLDQQSLASANTMLELLQSDDVEARASAAVLLWKHWDLEYASLAIREFQQLVRGSVNERLAALRSLVNTGDSRYAQYVKSYLDEEDESVRKAAHLALAHLVGVENRNLIQDVMVMMNEDDGEVRLAVFDALKQIGDSACIPLMLERADAYAPYEKRLAQQAILQLGLKSIPTCVRVLRNETYSYGGRSIAARAIAEMAFPQMQALAPSLVESEIRRSYQMIYCSQILQQFGSHQNGFVALGFFYQDEQIRSLGFILEILSLGGQIANHEMIAASLWSSSRDARSNAIETLEQSVSKSVYKKLLPLVDGRSRSNQVDFYRKKFNCDEMTIGEVIDFAWSSSNQLEKSIAAQVQFEWEDNNTESGADHFDQLLRRLCEDLDPSETSVRQVLTAMLRRVEGEVVDTIVDRIVCMKRTTIFSAVPVFELQELAAKMKTILFAPDETIYQEGEAANSFYLLDEGSVVLSSESSVVIAYGDVIGEKVIMGSQFREENASAETSVKVYELSLEYLEEFGKIHPNLSIKLHGMFALK